MSTTPSLLKLLVLATRAVEDELNAELRARLPGDLRPAHYAVFRYLDPEGSRVGDLADAAGMTQQSMGELVGRLESAGLVRREVDPGDRRARRVVCTREGVAVLGLAGDRLAAIEERIRTDVGPAELRRLRELLVRVAGSAGGPEGAATP
ncbi:MarR family winged helix-turn-helix transcriptional regulator [Nocardia sp. NPDC003345]